MKERPVVPMTQYWFPGCVEYWFMDKDGWIVWKHDEGTRRDASRKKNRNYFYTEKECCDHFDAKVQRNGISRVDPLTPDKKKGKVQTVFF